MRAAVMRGGQIEIEDLPEPTPGRGQILIEPHAAGICGSDLHAREVFAALAAQLPDQPPPPIVPGHEFAGRVVEIGADTDTSLRDGDIVTANPFTHGASGPDTIGLSPTRSGGLAELTVTDAARTLRLPDGVDATLGALCEPTAVAVHAWALAEPTGPIIVVGTGPIGLGIVAVAAIAGRGPIIAVDASEPRRAMAAALGADHVRAPGATLGALADEVGFAPSTISPLLDGDPAVITVFECVGRPDVVAALLADAPMHAKVVLAGACTHPVEVSPLQLTLREVTVAASYAYRHHEFLTAANLLRDHPDRFRRLITSERPLDDTAAAFDALASDPEELKIQIRPLDARRGDPS